VFIGQSNTFFEVFDEHHIFGILHEVEFEFDWRPVTYDLLKFVLDSEFLHGPRRHFFNRFHVVHKTHVAQRLEVELGSLTIEFERLAGGLG
jgi:hypothetical protein